MRKAALTLVLSFWAAGCAHDQCARARRRSGIHRFARARPKRERLSSDGPGQSHGSVGRTPIHFGATASQLAARLRAWNVPLPVSIFGPDGGIIPQSGPATNEPASPEQLNQMLSTLRSQLEAGALGIGMGLEYSPGATRNEVIELFRLAAALGTPVYVHVRSSGRVELGSSVEAINEVIGAAVISGASLHIVHINSSGMRDAPECLTIIAGARARRFEASHAAPEPRVVLIHTNPDELVDAVMAAPLVAVASDGLKDHPRGTGTHARVLAPYVREQKTLSLNEAIRKMSLMAAQRLERATPDAVHVGRLQEGKRADIVPPGSRDIGGQRWPHRRGRLPR